MQYPVKTGLQVKNMVDMQEIEGNEHIQNDQSIIHNKNNNNNNICASKYETCFP